MTHSPEKTGAFWQAFPGPPWQRWAALFFSLCVLSFLISVAVAQTLFSLAGICYAVDLLRRPRVPSFPPLRIPIALFCLFTVLSIGWAENPTIGWTAVRKLTLFLIILFTVNLIASFRHLTVLYRVMFVESAAAGLLAAGQFVAEYRALRIEHPGQLYYYMTLFRIHGFMGHWMNFGGQQMLVFIALVAYVLMGGRGASDEENRPEHVWWWWLVLGIVALSIILNFTRGVWLGCGAALLYLLARWRARWLWALPVLALAGYLAAPSLLRERLGSVLHPSADPSIAVRFEMWRVGLAMIRRHPLEGVGPNNVNEVYLAYLPRGVTPVAAWHEHLHDDYLQFAAERGLPCLAAWLWFMGVLGWQIFRIRRRLAREGRPTWLADASLASWLAFVIEGFFEFNFGTTPVLMVFLFVMSTPFAAERLLTAEKGEGSLTGYAFPEATAPSERP